MRIAFTIAAILRGMFCCSCIVLSLIHVQDALAAGPFDGNWVLNKAKMRDSELTIRKDLKRAGVPDSNIPRAIALIESVWSNIVIRDGKFTLSGESKTANCTIVATGNTGTISCDNGSRGTNVRVIGSEMIVFPGGLPVFLRKRF